MMNWIDFYLTQSVLVSFKSNDPSTKCGCILTKKDNTPISFGYNGFMRGIDNYQLPTTRPEKYKWFIHAEQNAIYNASRNGSTLLDATAYVSSKPCITCLQALHQCGISEVYYTDWSEPKMVEDQTVDFNKIIELTNIRVVKINKEELTHVIEKFS